MTITLAATLLSVALSPTQSTPTPQPAAATDEARIAKIVARITDSNAGDHTSDFAELRKTGAAGVRWLAERSAEPDLTQSADGSLLSWFEPGGDHIGEDLLPLLQHPDERVCAWSALAMANAMPPVVDVLVAEFASKERPRKLAAIRAARGFVEHYEIVAPKLARFVDDADAEVRYWATFALAGLTPASLPALFHALEHRDPRVRAAAAEGIQKSFYPFLTDKESGEWGGYATWHGLPPEMHLKEMSNDIVPRDGIGPLRAALKDSDDDVRFFAAMSLYELGASALPARAELDAARRDTSAGVRFWAVHALERTDPTPWIRLKRLSTILRKDSEAPTPLADAELTALAADLDHEPEWSPVKDWNCVWSTERDVRFEAVRELTARGLEALLARASSGTAANVESATKVLTALERELDARIFKLVRILDDEWGTDGPASKALVELGAVAMPELEHEILRYPRFSMGPPTYVEIADVLVKIGEPAIPAMALGLGHWRDCGRIFCTQALLASGEKSAPVMPAIVSAWRSVGADARVPGAEMRWESPREHYFDDCSGPTNTRAIAKLGPGALPVLVRALDDPHGLVRMRAATGLGSFEKAGAPALGTLVQRLADRQRYVALAAADAILRIAPDESAEATAARAKRDELGAQSK